MTPSHPANTRRRAMAGLPGRVLLATLTPLLLLGCQGSANQSSSSPTADAKAQDKKPNYEVIRRNRAPFSVVLAPGGRIQVVDLADERDQRVDKVILDTTVPTNSLITVSPTGIRVNAETKSKGPFKRNHTYEIRLLK